MSQLVDTPFGPVASDDRKAKSLDSVQKIKKTNTNLAENETNLIDNQLVVEYELLAKQAKTIKSEANTALCKLKNGSLVLPNEALKHIFCASNQLFNTCLRLRTMQDTTKNTLVNAKVYSDGFLEFFAKNETVLIKTPYMHRWKAGYKLVDFERNLPSILNVSDTKDMFKHDGRFDLYLFSVYGRNTKLYAITDGDNVDTKSIPGLLFSYYGMDDNGFTVRWVSCAARTDKVPEGLYTILTKRQPRPMSETQLLHLTASFQSQNHT